MQRCHLLTATVFLALTLVAPAVLAGCSHPKHASTSPTWTPAPSVSASPADVKWGAATASLRGRLLRQAWTTTPSILLRTGPLLLRAQLRAAQSQAPSFVARLMPVPQPGGFGGYRAVDLPWPQPLPEADRQVLGDVPAGRRRRANGRFLLVLALPAEAVSGLAHNEPNNGIQTDAPAARR